MKKINFILPILFLSLFLSCKKDVLIEKPKATVVESFYNTAGEVEAGLAAIYSSVRGQIGGRFWIDVLECQTEWGAGFTGSANFDGFRSMQGLDPAAAKNIEPIWNGFYVAIRNANYVIKYTPTGKILSEEAKNKYIGEARFMRAFTYFQLVRAWGGVPLYTEENMDQTTGVPKSTKEDVYQLILDDLNFAEANLPDNAPLLGKPSKLIAKSVLADVYFYMGLNKEASEKANEVILSQKYSLEKVSVEDDFNKIFGIGASSPEEVFYLKFNKNSPSQLVTGTQQIRTRWFGRGGGGTFTWHKESKFYSNWNDSDLRKHFNWYETTADSIARLYPPGQSAFPNVGVTWLACKKYNAPNETVEAFDVPVYRYADILLLYAEAVTRANGGPTSDAVEKLNMVHRRAYGYDPLLPSPVDFNISDYTTETFIDQVVQERGYEFQWEGKRWFDLVRSGRVKETMKKMIDRDVADKHLLWPIPSIEFDLNTAFKASDQNPGY